MKSYSFTLSAWQITFLQWLRNGCPPETKTLVYTYPEFVRSVRNLESESFVEWRTDDKDHPFTITERGLKILSLCEG